MPRQAFTKGQQVYIKGYSGYKEAKVTDPDIVQTSYGPTGRKVHYVSVRYVRDGKPDGHDWNVLNNRQQIVTLEVYTQIERDREIARLWSIRRSYTRSEEVFAAYSEQAKDIITMVLLSPVEVAADVLERLVALKLRGTFDLRTERSRHTTEEVANLRAEREFEAEAATVALEELGAKPWS